MAVEGVDPRGKNNLRGGTLQHGAVVVGVVAFARRVASLRVRVVPVGISVLSEFGLFRMGPVAFEEAALKEEFLKKRKGD